MGVLALILNMANKKAQSLEHEGISELVLWLIFFLIAGGFVIYFLIKKFAG